MFNRNEFVEEETRRDPTSFWTKWCAVDRAACAGGWDFEPRCYKPGQLCCERAAGKVRQAPSGDANAQRTAKKPFLHPLIVANEARLSPDF